MKCVNNMYTIAECVLHYIDGIYACTEWYENVSMDGGICFSRKISDSAKYFDIKKHGDGYKYGHCETHELRHGEGYQKIKFAEDIFLYGRFIVIGGNNKNERF